MVFVNCDEYKTVETTAPKNVVKYDGTIERDDKDAHIVVVGFGENNLR
jgi:predicted DNA-binding protein with PD1-like motif